jgi:hypothetical protein
MKTDQQPPRARQTAGQLRTTLISALAVVSALAACSGDDAEPAGRSDEQTTATSATTTTQARASDEEAAYPIIRDLVHEATALTDQLFQDPTAVEDPDNPDIERLRELYTEDSPTPNGVLEQLRALAEKHQRWRAAQSGVFRDLGVYRMTTLNDDKVRFRICASEDLETVDENNHVVAQRAQVTQGVGEARRVDGIWRFYGINIEDDRTLEIAPGTANPGFCDSLFGGEGAT